MSTALLAAFDQQQRWCLGNGAPFSGRVLGAAARWLHENRAPHDRLAAIAAIADDPAAAAVPLRLLAGLHQLALQGLQPWSTLWPPAAAPADDKALQAAVALAFVAQGGTLQRALAWPPQTNEVQRSAVLLPGLLHIAQRTGLPLALMEIGASAGLNLWADCHRLQTDAWAWGRADAPLVLQPGWRGPAPQGLSGVALDIRRRAACDVQPIDLAAAGEDLLLESYVWADQPERLQRLRIAIGVARTQMAVQNVSVQRASAVDFVQQQLAQRRPGQAWVLMHSVMWQYMPAGEQLAITALMQAAAATATPDAPLAWLRLEPPQPSQAMELRCQRWPTGADLLLARAHPHGAWVEWLADAAAP
ncbi:MAG: DUF2332 family protein [Rubrivivax sp.]|nr:DUF2332 family protein [Rubrivivax sp.]